VHHSGDRRDSRPFVVGEEGLPLRQHEQEHDLAFRNQLSRLFRGSLLQYFSSSRWSEKWGGEAVSGDEGSESNMEEVATLALHSCDSGRHA
jgi:hypothetical protein